MKPDAWMDETGDCYGEKVRAKYYDAKINLYSAATIRKWLEDEPSEEMLDAGQLPSTARKTWAAMIAAKLQSLEGVE